jgi:hypothetical protein
MIEGDYDYSSQKIQDDMENMLRDLESSMYFRDSLYTQSWLRAVLGSVTQRESWPGAEKVNISTEKAFNTYLEKVITTLAL